MHARQNDHYIENKSPCFSTKQKAHYFLVAFIAAVIEYNVTKLNTVYNLRYSVPEIWKIHNERMYFCNKLGEPFPHAVVFGLKIFFFILK